MQVLSKTKGFTLIELLVVIAIIGFLASVVLGSVSQAKSSARDANRRLSLKNFQIAMEIYYQRHNTYRVANSGWANGGEGWFGYEDGGMYTTAVTRALYNERLLGAPLVEDPIQEPGYMIYLCGEHTYAISATLENPTPEDISHIQTTCNGVGGNGTYTRYGKNFAVTND